MADNIQTVEYLTADWETTTPEKASQVRIHYTDGRILWATPAKTSDLKGGVGSGNFDHAGIPDHRGGSLPKSSGEGSPSFDRVLGWDDRFPSTSEDPAPGGAYEYHSTFAQNLPAIGRDGLVPSKWQQSISVTPHLEGAQFYGDIIDGGSSDPAKQAVLLRVSREGLRINRPSDDEEFASDDLDWDPSREHQIQQSVSPDRLEVFFKGSWIPVSSLQEQGK